MKAIGWLWMILFSAHAMAVTPEGILNSGSDGSNMVRGFNRDYRIGDEWGKKPVTDEDLNSDEFFRRMALATAKIRGGGTGFYLGEFNGQYMMATNHHVCPYEWSCGGGNAVQFPKLGLRTRVAQFYGSWSDIDLALFSIRIEDPAMVTKLNAVASPFAFHEDLRRGQKLVTIGFGVANNSNGALVANRDADCMVFSGPGEYRKMGDPDAVNPSDYAAWSFANGCDVSHGDSGSAMMDRETGRVIGIIWTGKIPKSSKVQSSAYLQELLKTGSEEIWQELSYGVPAVKMKAHLLERLKAGEFSEAEAATILTMLQ